MRKMVENGVLTEERYQSLIDNKWNHDIILHEAGVPPLHTPVDLLKELPNSVYKNKINFLIIFCNLLKFMKF